MKKKSHLFSTCTMPRVRKSYIGITAFKNMTYVSHITVHLCSISHVIEVKAKLMPSTPQNDTLLNIN